MFLNETMTGLADYIGTTQEIAAMLIAVIIMIAVMAALSYYADLRGFPLMFTMISFVGLWTVLGWFPVWVPLFLMVVALAYIFFAGGIEAVRG